MRHPSLSNGSVGFKSIEDHVQEYSLELEGLARHLLQSPEQGRSPLVDTVPAVASFRGVKTLRLWLHRAASTEARHLVEGEANRKVDSYLDSVVEGGPDHRLPDRHDLAGGLQARMEILESLAGLPDNYLCAVLLKEGEGLAVEEVSRLMGTTSASVRSVLYRARHTIRERTGL
ncbi:MAG TPA: sigma factor-like helix-turn-helix DNA-binding protein [Acidimicrobiia bacterium]|nr:sigma factor-like helix-turn-helix DNA-binding protein [Acidimicrobiia bacterium]